MADDTFMGSNAFLDVYTAWFAARTDLYVKNAAEVVRAPITPDVLRAAVEHHYAISAYTAAEDGTTWVGAIDFDTDDGLAQARTVVTTLAKRNAPSLLAHSRRGAHVWLTCWSTVTASTMRRALGAALAQAGLAEDPKIEVFPKPGDDLAAGALRMPGMPHQRTQQVYPIEMLDADGWHVVGDGLIDLLEAHMPVEAAAIHALAKSHRRQQPYPKALGGFYGSQPAKDWGPNPKASEVLARWGITVVPGHTVQCPKHDDHRRSLTVFKDDERVYCGSPGCVLHGGGHGVGSVMLARMEGTQ